MSSIVPRLAQVLAAILMFAAMPAFAAEDAGQFHVEALNLLAKGDIEGGRQKAEKYREWVILQGRQNDPRLADATQDLAMVHMMKGDVAEADKLAQRALAMIEAEAPLNPMRLATALGLLGGIHGMQGRVDEARALAVRSQTLFKSANPGEQDVLAKSARIAELDMQDAANFKELEDHYLAVIAHFEKSLPEFDKNIVGLRIALASFYGMNNRCDLAEPILALIQAAHAVQTDPAPLERGMALQQAGECKKKQGNLAAAEADFLKVLDLNGQIEQDGMFAVAPLVNLAEITHRVGRDGESLSYARRASAIRQKELTLGAGPGRGRTDQAKRFGFDPLITAAWGSANGTGADPAALAREAFLAAQWASQNATAGALNQLGDRLAARSGDVASLIRASQDLKREWQRLDQTLVQLLVTGSAEPAIAKARARMGKLEHDLTAAEAAIASQSPGYAGFIGLKPLGLDEAKRLLGADEALIVIHTGETQTFIWAVTLQGERWTSFEISRAALTERVLALRCGLDETAWRGPGAERCLKRLDLDSDEAWQPGQALPFDLEAAHQLYESLFGGLNALIAGKHLLIVPSGALSSLPFQVLVTTDPNASNAVDILACTQPCLDRAAFGIELECVAHLRDPVAGAQAVYRLRRPRAGGHSQVHGGHSAGNVCPR